MRLIRAIVNIIGVSITKSKIDLHADIFLENGDSFITFEDVCMCMTNHDIRSYLQIYRIAFPETKFFAYSALNIFLDKDEEDPKYWPDSDDGVWSLTNYCNTLFVKWDNFMLYKIFGDKKYPPVKTLIFESYPINSPEFEMHRLYDKIYTSKYENVKKYYLQDISKLFRKYNGIICFKKLHTLVRSGFNGFFFIDRSLRVKFRDDGYRIAYVENNVNKINNNNNNNNVIEIGVITRKNNSRKREIVNLKDVLSLLNDLQNKNKYNIKYEVFYFDEKSARDQILLIMNKQIIISPHGANLCNILWILSVKAVIIECYSIFRTDAYMKLSVMMNYRYFPLPSPYINALDVIGSQSVVEYNFAEFPYIHHNRFYYHPIKHFPWAGIIVSIKQVLFSMFLSFNEFKLKK